jgi:L,D-peptidoglycan transpeptidase YkuD (ErfK/YbiS/YcfS/YnhG family)
VTIGRVIAGFAASLAVAGGAFVAVGMSRETAPGEAADASVSITAVDTFRPTYAALPTPTATTARASVSRRASSSTTDATKPAALTTSSTPAAGRTSSRRIAAPATAPASSSVKARPRPPEPANRPATHVSAAAQRGVSLPLHFGTGSATRVITVTAHSAGSTVARLQAWTKASGGGWRKYGRSVTAHIGAQGMSRHPSESKSATPIGSFTFTRAFGHYANPGTSLHYFQTRPSDWWISQPGPLYNTHQRCASNCEFTRGSPNEHLYYETPYYNYAVVIDYNTRNAPGGVRQGAGSAFFLHVTDGAPTAGCVAIAQSRLITLMRWLSPTAHPRILIGTV